MQIMGDKARQAASILQNIDASKRTEVLKEAARQLEQRSQAILLANQHDIEAGRQKGLSEAMLDRLLLTQARIDAMAKGVLEVSELEDPVGCELARWQRPNGLDIARVATPIGVIAVIYESRPQCHGRCRCPLS